jgi:hypothetical protein
MTDPNQIASSLTPDERELLRHAGFAGISFYSGPLHQLNGKELLHLDVEKTAHGDVRKFSARHTSLGLAVRAIIERDRK